MTEKTFSAEKNSAIAICDSHQQAEKAVKELQNAAFDVRKLSIIGKGYQTEDQVIGYYNAGDRMKHWGKYGAYWGALWGLLMGVGFLIVPGIGAVLIAGPIVAALEGAVAVGGVSVIGSALYSIGIPKNTVLRYDSALKADKFLVVVHGTEKEVQHARDILAKLGASDITIGKQPEAETASTAGQ